MRVHIERTDFSPYPPPDWTCLSPGAEMRLRHAYFIRCDEAVTDPASGVWSCAAPTTPESMGRPSTAACKRSTAIQWVSAAHALPVEARSYSRLFTTENPDEVEEGKTFKDYLNPQSVEILPVVLVEPAFLLMLNPAIATSSCATVISSSARRDAARQAGLQPHRRAA